MLLHYTLFSIEFLSMLSAPDLTPSPPPEFSPSFPTLHYLDITPYFDDFPSLPPLLAVLSSFCCPYSSACPLSSELWKPDRTIYLQSQGYVSAVSISHNVVKNVSSILKVYGYCKWARYFIISGAVLTT